MRVTLAVSKFYTNLDLAQQQVTELVDTIGAQLGAVEEVIDLGARYTGVLIVRIVSARKHENSDHLNICMIDDGGVAEGVERDTQGYVQVVCGAPNVREGLCVVWLPPGSTVPSSYDDDPFVLETRNLRGVLSNGMLASPKELSISDNHEGILEIDDDNARPGQTFAELYDLNDHVIDIENKMFTHRPDCFGLLGVYREIAGITHQQFESPAWYAKGGIYSLDQEAQDLPLTVQNEVPELVARLTVIPMANVTVHQSPVWLQIYLMRVGIRPINNVVDVTNYLMYLTGQPLHAYDYDKVKAQDANAEGATLIVRQPHAGEKIVLLNGKEIEPRQEAIMIASRDKLIGVGGVMGGGDTEVDENTKNIIIECATFDMYSIRRTSMAHGLFTDAVTRFNKGQSPLQNARIIAKVVQEMRQLAGAQVAGPLVDDKHFKGKAYSEETVHAPVSVTAAFINARLGSQLSADEMAVLLRNVECDVTVSGDELTITAPFWRTDIELPEDVVEEVGRLYGYDRLPLVLPRRDLTPSKQNQQLRLKATIREILRTAGANEVLTYSFVHGNLLEKVGQDREQAYQLSNALSPDLQYYRLSLLPSLLEKVHANVKAGYSEFALFELGKTHATSAVDEAGLPREFDNLSFVYAAEKTTKPGAAYYEARAFLVHLAKELGLQLEFTLLPAHVSPLDAPFEQGRTALVKIHGQSEAFGIVGELKASVRRALKLPEKTAAFELGIGPLMKAQTGVIYTALPRFPKIEQDICLKVAASLPYQELYSFVLQTLEVAKTAQTRLTVAPLDIYQKDDDVDHKQITFRVTVANYEKTMRDTEVSELLTKLADAVASTYQAKRI